MASEKELATEQTQSVYQYEALTPPNGHIRLLREIRSNPHTSQPDCVLEPVDLLHLQTPDYDYTALSYIWGDPTPNRTIFLNGECHHVPQNLFEFFEAYLKHDWGSANGEPRKWETQFWIDQICINQNDAAERNAQVGMMNKIFKRARRVLVPETITAACELQEGMEDQEAAVLTILSHPYFSRVWVEQEIALAARIEIVCGEVQLEWTTFKNALALLAGVLMVTTSQEQHTLEQCIADFSDHDCQDPRDKVYGLLGMTSERWRVRIDYQKTVPEVFLDTAMALFEELFDFLDSAGHDELERDSAKVPKRHYLRTLDKLARRMGLEQHRIWGSWQFLRDVQDVFLNTTRREIQYTYTGLIHCTPLPARRPTKDIDSLHNTEVREEEDDQVLYWGSIMATRRNPLVRDVIPNMGLQMAAATMPNGTNERCTNAAPAYDRWWYEYNRRIFYIECSSPSPDVHSEDFEVTKYRTRTEHRRDDPNRSTTS